MNRVAGYKTIATTAVATVAPATVAGCSLH